MTTTNTMNSEIDRVASIMASMRQGQSDTPRCEPPSKYDIEWCRDRIKEVDAARETLAKHYTRQPPSDAMRNAVIEECAAIADDHAFNAWHIAEAEGQNGVCASGRNYGGRAIAKAIRALSQGKPDAG